MYVCIRLCISLCFEVSSWNSAWGLGTGPWGLRAYFEATPPKIKGHPEVKCLRKFGGKNPWPKCNALLGLKIMKGQPGVKLFRNVLWPPDLVGRIFDQSVMHCWGQMSCRGQGSTTGQIDTKFGRRNPWPECNALMGSKIMQGSSGVNQRVIAPQDLRPLNMANVALALERNK